MLWDSRKEICMNVIISNKYQDLLNNINIDVIKNINGEFTSEEIVSQFTNFFFNKMIIDITAIKDYENINVIQDLSLGLDMDKVILLLDDSPKVNSPMYLSQLVSMGIYNFTRDVNNISFLIDNPNTYKDVAQYHNLKGINYNPLNSISEANEQKLEQGFIGQRVIGIQNVTEHAGSTTLTYILKKHLNKLYKVKTVELDSEDFIYFNDRELEHISSTELSSYISKNNQAEVILVDLNGNSEGLCNDVLYLIEPGLIKLNKLIRKNGQIFEELKDKKIILNKSVLNETDLNEFERESGSKVFFNIPPVDDKLDDQEVINEFLTSLGFSRFTDNNGKNNLFNIF
jgi:hypothetical protein